MENLNGLEVFQKKVMEQTREILANSPMWMRLNYLSHSISSLDEDKIDWGKIRSLLSENLDIYDYNVIDEIHNMESFAFAVYACRVGSLNMSVWQVHTCNDCHQKFDMTYGEVNFFKEKGFSLPKRCRICRKIRNQK